MSHQSASSEGVVEEAYLWGGGDEGVKSLVRPGASIEPNIKEN